MKRYTKPIQTVIPAVMLALGLLLMVALPADAQGMRERRGARDHSCMKQAMEQLDLTHSQRDELTRLRQERDAAVDPLKEQVRTRVRTLRSENPDFTRETARNDSEIQALREQIHELASGYREKISSVLTEEQKAQMKEAAGECRGKQRGCRKGQGGGARHGWGGGPPAQEEL